MQFNSFVMQRVSFASWLRFKCCGVHLWPGLTVCFSFLCRTAHCTQKSVHNRPFKGNHSLLPRFPPPPQPPDDNAETSKSRRPFVQKKEKKGLMGYNLPAIEPQATAHLSFTNPSPSLSLSLSPSSLSLTHSVSPSLSPPHPLSLSLSRSSIRRRAGSSCTRAVLHNRLHCSCGS